MYVVLTQDVPSVGSKNHLLNVSKGYFMNFLQPRRFAIIPTPGRIETLKVQILAQKDAAALALQQVSEKSKSLQAITLLLSGKASVKGTLFKALGERDVISALKKQAGVDVEKSDIEMEHLKKIGDHEITVKIGGQKVTVKVKLEAKAEEKK